MTPEARAAVSGRGASRSTVIAVATMPMAPRSITSVPSRTIMKAAQHRAQCRPKRRPYPQAVRRSGGGSAQQPGASRQHRSWRDFHDVS